MNYLETLVYQWLDYRGYFVRSNVNVGRLQHGGHAGEIDIAAFHPTTQHCLHVECSGDALSWKDRAKRLEPKFRKGQEFIRKEIFPSIPDKPIEQWALVWNAGKTPTIGGVKVVALRRLYLNIASDILELNRQGNRSVPEKYCLLRAIQQTMTFVGDARQIEAISGEDLLLPPEKGR